MTILFAEAEPPPVSAGVASVARLGGNFARELASEEATNPYAATARYAIDGDPHPSKILQTKSKPDQRVGELYTHILESDTDLSGLFDKRIDAVLSVPRRIVPADGSPRARETADFCRAALGVVPSFALNLRHQLLAIATGIAFDEIMAEKLTRGPLAGAWVPVDVKDRPMHRFGFKGGVLHIRHDGSGERLRLAPEGKFLHYSRGTKDSPWGKAMLDELYWAWWLKKNGMKFWSIFLDKWGMPTTIGRYRSSNDDKTNQANQAKLLAVIEAIQSQYGITLPEGLDVELLEAARSGSVSYEQFQALLLRTMALKVLGEVDTSGLAKGPGSFAKADVSNDVRLEKAALDAHEFSAYLKDTLLARLVAWNYGPEWPVPLWTVDTVDADDRDQRGKGIDAVLNLGLPVGERYVRMTHRVPEVEPGEPVIQRTPPQTAPAAAAAPKTPAPPPPPGGNQAAAAAPRAAHRAAAFAAKSADEGLRQAETRMGELDQLAAVFVPRTLDYYTGWKQELAAAFDAGDVAAKRALRRLVGAINPLEQARGIETAQMHAFGLSLWHVAQDVGISNLKLALPPGLQWSPSDDPQTAMEYWATQLVIPKDVFLGLADEARRAAFTVAGVNDIDILGAVHALIGEAINQGWTRERFVAALDAVFQARGVDPLARWHAELIYANATRTAANLLRYQQLVLNPAARGLTPYLTWWSLDDGKVRPEHVAMHGYTAATDHRIWKTWWPPAGHNCRCYIGTVSLPKARREGLTGAEPMGPWPLFEGSEVMPDPGFAGVASMTAVADQASDRAARAVDAARESGDPDFLDSILQLFAQLFGASASPTSLADFVYGRAA